MFHPSELTHRDEIGDHGGHFLSVEMAPRCIERLAEYSVVPNEVAEVGGKGQAALAMQLYREFQESDACSPLAVEGIVMADQSHFTRVFRRLTGTTPGAYRAAIKDRHLQLGK